MRNSTSTAHRIAKVSVALATTLSFAGLGVVGASTASADETGQGWVRVAHLSPDTKSVDVKLTALAGGGVVSELDGVAYGAVSDYIDVPQGTYVVSMVPAGSPDSTTPVIQQSVDIVSGEPVTVAAYGKNADLATTVFPDDLTPPADGEARVRVIQASTTAESVDIATSTGTPITAGAEQGTATNYASVAAGPWTLDVTGERVGSGSATTTQADIDLASGSVATLFVLDDSTGGVTVKPVIDSASVGDLPTGGIQTGGGATAAEHIGAAQVDASEGLASGLGIAMLAALPLAGALALVIVRRTARAEAR
ncbi:DUF4397 domain-containing protein [Herbiconiux sp.]|uniref:DUF4397 domain-containing protein n=1 Tax=Herbiconiux sp. TaxID=1871186 RepID=UPI0025C490E8|nr:DUF4397 domain-containing protein [Herbiconiux sp.]